MKDISITKLRALYNLSNYIMSKLCLALIAFIAVLLFTQPVTNEGFDLRPLQYNNLGRPLLYDYKEKTIPRLSSNESQDIYTNYPVFPADSCKNNNIRYWKRPTNGKCSPAEFCESLYDTTLQNISPPIQSQPWTGVTRVNYYASCE